jgi:hypothetical protein
MTDYNNGKGLNLDFELLEPELKQDSSNSDGLSHNVLLLLNNSHIRNQHITDETIHQVLDYNNNTLVEMPVGYYNIHSFSDSVNERLEGRSIAMGSSCLYGCEISAKVYLSMGMVIDSKFPSGGYFDSCTLHDSACMENVTTNNLIIKDSILHWSTLENGGHLSNCSLINCNTEDVLLFSGSVIQRGHNHKTRFAESGVNVVGGKEVHSSPIELIEKLDVFPIAYIKDNWERKGSSIDTYLRISPDTQYLPIINHFNKTGLDISCSYGELDNDEVHYGKMTRYLQTSKSENARLINAIYNKANADTLFKLNGAYFPSVYQHKNKMIGIGNKDASGTEEILAPSTSTASEVVKSARTMYLKAVSQLDEFKVLSGHQYDSLDSVASGQQGLFSNLDESVVKDIGNHVNVLRNNFVESIKVDAKSQVVKTKNVSNLNEDNGWQLDIFGDCGVGARENKPNESNASSVDADCLLELNDALLNQELIADVSMSIDDDNVEPTYLNSQIDFDNVMGLLDGLAEVNDNLIIIEPSASPSMGMS